MDPNIEKLKSRLTAGEISVGEYRELLAVLTAPSGLGSAASGRRSDSPPTLGPPLAEIRNPEHGTITLYETAIVVGGAKRDLADVVSVRRCRFSFGVNLVPVANYTSVLVKFRDGVGINISESRVYTSFGAHKALGALASLLGQMTSQARLNELVSRLRRDGRVLLYKDDKNERSVALTSDGTIKKGDFLLNLKEADSILVWPEDSDEETVTIIRKKLKDSHTFGIGAPKDRIEFVILEEDKDIVLNLLAWFAEPGNQL